MENKIVALISKYYIVFVGIYISICNVNLFKIAIFRLLASDGSGRVMEIIISQKRIFKKIFFFKCSKCKGKVVVVVVRLRHTPYIPDFDSHTDVFVFMLLF